ncbi:acetyl/propionyl/methylcrotonyl-CoA carboxylase subunit alpha [Brevundimonas subvibrioides]|uniref:Carbamoyl-phosphate synthase L chain ATP-binding protein n=1 Tax=Brevundimonas subvibrioides (strain ATCC 15264 / DSM 4735 / LMG 14903 / NBRC 16000 / CB 81) TaxID=633149 RepID=D9QGS8_BRESC|nr:biotin carboxylase N-terminal domain-containing protein [Brevundimonas subvibrioides]ADL00894.1 Carbamoyl-phosphate synthase L chain ATP-binding protein [Brevundimonas subvibrioides ATCC 15264]
MFTSVLVANRGEIACRVFRTAKRMGIRTIAVYSEADAKALHVREADEAVLIGPAPARESYLDAARVLAAAKATGAEAIHPGYGFLSENAEFAEAVMAAGIVWIGAPPAAIRAMGLKDAAKKLMVEAGVPVTPGYMGEDQSPERLKAEADAIGYPVLIKAVAGGGGKGMRRVDAAEAFLDALGSCRREAASSFGDDRVLIEKYILSPRHIEVQVFGDAHGEVVHLFERDCSLQRRHQKVIEEAPAPGMDEATRAAVTAAAVKAAKAVNYVGAGTIEFIADGTEGLRADRIWFMEMNTRLQVEHPVTEAITGVDLVEWQFRAAAGEPVPLRQDQLAIHGWAMEARLYAEDPANGFLPSIGKLEHFVLPDGVRIDTGVEQGGEVSQFYDPMIAKLIVHAETREEAAAGLAEACGSVEVWPVRTNAGFLVRCLEHPRFVAGDVDTGFIGAEEGALTAVGEPPEAVIQDASDLLWRSRAVDSGDAWDTEYGSRGFRLNGAAVMQQTFFIDGIRHQAGYLNGYPVVSYGPEIDGGLVVFHGGDRYEVSRQAPRSGAAGTASDGSLRAPMPGKIVATPAKAGDVVTKGQPVIVLEAMKMEHALNAPFDGVVGEVAFAVGDQVAADAVLAVVEADV